MKPERWTLCLTPPHGIVPGSNMYAPPVLREAVIEYLAGGGSFTKMVIGELDFPALALPDIRIVPYDPGLYDEEDDPDLYDEEDAAGQDDPIALPRSEPVAHPANPTVTAITDALPPLGTARHRRRRSRRR